MIEETRTKPSPTLSLFVTFCGVANPTCHLIEAGYVDKLVSWREHTAAFTHSVLMVSLVRFADSAQTTQVA